MKRALTVFLITALLLCAGGLRAQTDPGPQPDEEFNILVLAVVIALFGIVVGATLIGSMVATLALLGLFGLATAGILSAGVLVGLYRKSVSAGFKVIVGITGCLGGIAIGEIAFYLINRIFHLHLSGTATLLIGGFGGLIGGLLLGLVLYQLIRVFLLWFKRLSPRLFPY